MPVDPSQFKDVMGRFRTLSLFYELNTTDLPSVFTLKEREHKGYPSLKQIFLSYTDPTEYTFAMEVFGSWTGWQKISESAEIKKHVDQWREELEIKIRAEAIKAIAETAVTEGAKGTAAARWIAEGNWKGRRGRPSKAEVERERKIQAGIQDDISDDIERMGLKH